jgi:hypothetical protein
VYIVAAASYLGSHERRCDRRDDAGPTLDHPPPYTVTLKTKTGHLPV